MTVIKVIVIVALFSFQHAAVAAKMYTWTDEDGQQHFSQTPPNNKPNLEYQEKNIATQRTPAGASITTYMYPFKEKIAVKMRLADICNTAKARKNIIRRGIPANSPEYEMMLNMASSQCEQARHNKLKNSIAYDIKGRAILEVFKITITKEVSLFNITLREYSTKSATHSTWEKIQKQKNENTQNNNYILVNSRFNSAAAYINTDNVIIQVDLMLKTGNALMSLNNFASKYSIWLNTLPGSTKQ